MEPLDEVEARVRLFRCDVWDGSARLALNHNLVLHLLDEVNRF
jgi:hypothetical protein